MESVLDVPSQAEQKYGLKIFYFAWKAFIANLFFPIMTPPLTHPTIHPQDYWGGDTKRSEEGLIKVKNKLTLNFISGDWKHF